MADERTYTAVEHKAILETEVARAIADLRVAREELETEKSGLQTSITDLQKEKADLLTRVDKAEAEKAAAEKAKADIEAEFTTFKADLDRKNEIAQLKADRTAKAKAELAGVGEDYFTEERCQRWAEMSAEAFDAVLADLTESAAKKPPMDEDEAKKAKDAKAKKDTEDPEKAARETAAFKGGAEPTAHTGSTFMQLMAARRTA